jgi:hypothetical protein
VALLSSRLELRDIRDVEQFAGRIVERSGLALNYYDREDLLDSLIVCAWECSVSGDYDPSKGAFSTFATYRLRSAVTAWLRSSQERTGRTGFVGGRTTWKFRDRVHKRPQRVLVSLDGSERGRLVDALAEGDGDREANRDASLGGLLDARDREADRDYAILGLEPPRRAAR